MLSKTRKFDLVIIGAGAAGFAAATKANELKIKAVLINSGLPLGGTCVNVGCLPTKHLLQMGMDYFYPQHPKFASLAFSNGSFDFRKAIRDKDELITKLREAKYEDVLNSFDQISYLEGHAAFVSETTVQVNDKKLEAEKFLIATGSSPFIPPN